jgi:exosortase D (VPLPA-CTERM-specific)
VSVNATVESRAAQALGPVPSFGLPGMLLALVVAAALAAVFSSGLILMAQWWIATEEYSYGWLVPPIAAFLVWQRRDVLRGIPLTGSWAGLVLVALGLVMGMLGELSAVYTLIQYGFLLALAGAVLSLTGWRAFRIIAVALFTLLLMVPLPSFIYFPLSQQLQLLSSELGVWFIRLCGISVYLEGNVIDLGDYKLQVAEACSGLRYLFPLMTLGFIVALFYRAALWKRKLVFVSAAVITVLMNSFRIGVIGVLVSRFGPAQAEGFLHWFEGWVIFMACVALLLLEIWLLERFSSHPRRLRDALAIELPARAPPAQPRSPRPVPASAWAAAGLLAVAVVPALMIPERVEAAPPRAQFAEFPLQLGEWSGRHERLEAAYIEELKLTDYLLADYQRRRSDAVNLYVAYYASQRKGESAHSPKGCLPGGGWVIEQFGQRQVSGVSVGSQSLVVNRALIAHGNERQLVYYWFQQRGRVLTNEYLVKWFLFWDSLTRKRTDGALVRLITPLSATTDADSADALLREFARVAEPRLQAYVPD